MPEQQQILYMQIRLVRLASKYWGKTMEATADLFKKFSVFKYIEDCFYIFHTEGDEAIFEDIKQYLTNKGAIVKCKN